jgi:putative ABC transport system ATP-binding protein
MNHALAYGNRLVMMHEGEIVEDLSLEEKAALSSKDLIALFQKNAHSVEDRMVLQV